MLRFSLFILVFWMGEIFTGAKNAEIIQKVSVISHGEHFVPKRIISVRQRPLRLFAVRRQRQRDGETQRKDTQGGRLPSKTVKGVSDAALGGKQRTKLYRQGTLIQCDAGLYGPQE